MYTEALCEGHYHKLNNLKDPTVSAALLKKWMRGLSPMLIPTEFHSDVLKAGEARKEELCWDIINRLPHACRCTTVYILKFMQELTQYKDKTKMRSSNLALVIAPSLVRGPNVDPTVILKNSKAECTFVEILIDTADSLAY